jgi:hypothetical protein
MSALGDCVLVAACLISATPRDQREALLRELELWDHPSIRVTWHETLSAQFLCVFISMAAFIVIGLALADTLFDVQTILYSWIIPESLPFFLAYLVFFALFSDFPDRTVQRKKSTFARLTLGLIVAFACALSVRVWWLLASVHSLPPEPLYGEGAILALGSVGAAAIAIASQNWALRPSIFKTFSRIAGLALASFVLCSVWNATTAQAYIRQDERARLAHHAALSEPTKQWWLLTVTFPGCIVLSLLAGTVMVARRRETETAEVEPAAPHATQRARA